MDKINWSHVTLKLNDAYVAPLDVLNPEVREILKKACHGKDAEDYVFTNPDTGRPFYDIKRSFHTALRKLEHNRVLSNGPLPFLIPNVLQYLNGRVAGRLIRNAETEHRGG